MCEEVDEVKLFVGVAAFLGICFAHQMRSKWFVLVVSHRSCLYMI